MSGHADYRVQHSACVPLTPVTDATVVLEQRVPVQFQPQADDAFRADKPAALNHPQDPFTIQLRVMQGQR